MQVARPVGHPNRRSRLTRTQRGVQPWRYGYDANGNRTEHESPTFPGLSTYTTPTTSNRLSTVSQPAMAWAYDAQGNATSPNPQNPSTHWQAQVHPTGQISRISWGPSVTGYHYDGERRRVLKDSSANPGGGWTVFVYGLRGELLGEYDQLTGAAIREYVWLGDTPVALLGRTASSQTDEVFFVHTDHLDTPRLATDRLGRIRWSWMAEPFGNEAANMQPTVGLDAVNLPLRMPGQYWDAESGLFYNHHRYYEPRVGRYVSSDPIGLEGGINTYAYANGNPVSFYDPYGLFGMDDVWGGVHWATGGWSPSQGAVDFSAGLGDALLLGAGGYLREAAGVDGGVDHCSDAYRYGSYAALAAGGGRVAYAGLAKAGSVLAASGAEASAFRAGLKTFFRGGIGRNWRPPKLAGKTDAQLRASAGKTNLSMNAYGAGVGAAGGMNATQCGCPK